MEGNYLTGNPIADIETAFNSIRNAGGKIRYVLMDRDKWEQFKKSQKVIETIEKFYEKGTKPTLKNVNGFLAYYHRSPIYLIKKRKAKRANK